MKTLRNNAKIPAVAITYAGRTDEYQPIILKSQENSISPWVITTVSVAIVRDWSISRATIMLTAELGDSGILPKLPDLSTIRGGKYNYLMEEDEIRIYTGYVDSSSTVIDKDLLDEFPFDVDGIKENIAPIKQDPNKPLCPIFWGFIDQVRYSLTSKGLRCVLECRDRMRVLHDTKMITLGSHQTSDKEGKVDEVQTEVLAATGKGVAQSSTGIFPNMIIEAANTAAGQGIGYSATVLSNSKKSGFNGCWKPIVGGLMPIFINGGEYAFPPSLYKSDYTFMVNLESGGTAEQVQEGAEETATAEKNTSNSINKIFMLDSEKLGAMTVYPWVNNDSPQYYSENYPDDPVLWVKQAAFKKVNPFSIPRFHIWSERAPLESHGANNVYQVTDQSPASMIVELAGIENLPTDVYASHVNGDFIYGPRIIDMTGFSDESRSYRTYFAMTWDPGLFTNCPLEAQRIIKMDAVSTSLGVFNNLYVLAKQSGGKYHDFIDSLVLFLKSSSPEYAPKPKNTDFYGAGRIVNPPCRNTVLVDSSLTSFSRDNVVKAAAAIGIALNYARIWSRQINTIKLEIPGDPTLYPNEAIRVYNTGLHDEGISIPFNANEGPIDDILGAMRSVIDDKNIAENLGEIDAKLKEVLTTAIESVIDALDEDVNRKNLTDIGSSLSDLIDIVKNSSEPTSMTEGNLPIYQIRAIEHVIVTEGAKQGYTTKVEAIASL